MRYCYSSCFSAAPWLVGIGYIFLIGIIIYLFFCLHKADKANLELSKKVIYYESCRDIRDAVEKVHKWEDEWRQFNFDRDMDGPR